MTSRTKKGEEKACKMQDGLYLPTKFSGEDIMFICQVYTEIVEAPNPKRLHAAPT